MTEKRICPGRNCGADLTGAHFNRKWCSVRCRRRTEYTNTCACGAEIYDGTTTPPQECGECKYEREYGDQFFGQSMLEYLRSKGFTLTVRWALPRTALQRPASNRPVKWPVQSQQGAASGVHRSSCW